MTPPHSSGAASSSAKPSGRSKATTSLDDPRPASRRRGPIPLNRPGGRGSPARRHELAGPAGSAEPRPRRTRRPGATGRRPHRLDDPTNDLVTGRRSGVAGPRGRPRPAGGRCGRRRSRPRRSRSHPTRVPAPGARPFRVAARRPASADPTLERAPRLSQRLPTLLVRERRRERASGERLLARHIAFAAPDGGRRHRRRASEARSMRPTPARGGHRARQPISSCALVP